MVLAPHGEVTKALPVVRFSTHKLLFFPQKPARNTCRSGYQHMSTPNVLLKADPRLEGDVADGKADISACLALFLRDSWLHGPQTCVQTGWTFLRSSCHSGYTVLVNREEWRVAGDLVPQEAPNIS